TLEVSTGDKRGRVIFDHGRVAWAVPADPTVTIASTLSTHGLLTKEQLDSLAGKKPSEALAAKIIKEEQIRFYVSEAVLDLFTWQEGKFSFNDSGAMPDGAVAVSLDTAPLIQEGLKRLEDMLKILRLYPDDSVSFKVIEEVAQQGKISLTAEEFKILFRIGNGRPLKLLVQDLGKARVELYATLHNLEKNGLIAKSGGAGPSLAERTATQPGTDPGTRPAPEPSSKATPSRMPTQSGAPVPPPPAKAPAAAPPPPPPAAAKAKPSDAKPAAPATPATPPSPASGERPKTTLGRRIPIGSLTPDGDIGNVYPLMEDECTIGREASNKIVIPDGSVSSNHARITRSVEGFFLEDLQSRNGTYVNGEKISQKTKLSDNDLVRLGKVIMTFNIATDSPGTNATQFETPMP
ncbi:MAG: FHA domain-containing protein, partial [Thermoanaerobaculia bacterium]